MDLYTQINLFKTNRWKQLDENARFPGRSIPQKIAFIGSSCS